MHQNQILTYCICCHKRCEFVKILNCLCVISVNSWYLESLALVCALVWELKQVDKWSYHPKKNHCGFGHFLRP